MPGQKSQDKAPVHVSIPKAVIWAARLRLDADERTMTELVEHALGEYAAGTFTLPPPPPRADP